MSKWDRLVFLDWAGVQKYPTEQGMPWVTRPGVEEAEPAFPFSVQFSPLSHKYLGEHGPKGVGRWLLLLLENVFLLFSGKSPSSDENKLKSHQ